MNIGSQSGVYRIDALLGRGGMAEVYKAWNTGLHRFEALKVLPPEMTYDKSFVDRFLSEARMAAGLHHPNIATIHAVSAPDAAQPYFAMELIEGEDLADLLQRRGALPLAEALAILRQIAAALDYAHSRGVVHRDVKPANVLLQQNGTGWNAKVVDFGIARAQESEGGARLTKAGMIVGTPEYMSPEQGGNGEKVDHRSDQYSLGIVTYEMLCGQPPFRLRNDGSPISVIISHQRDTPAPLLDRVPDLPRHVNEAILKALGKHPADRWANCSAFVEACCDAKPNHPPARRQKPIFPAALAVAGALGSALVVISLARSGDRARPVAPASASPIAAAYSASSIGETSAPPFSLSPANESNAPASAAEDGGWRSWRRDGFALEYPSNWTVAESASPDSRRVQFKAPEPNVSVLVDTSFTNSTQTPLAGAQEMDHRLQKAHGQNYRLLSITPSSVDGVPAAAWVFTLMRKGKPPMMKKNDISTVYSGRGYALLMSAPADSYASWQGPFAHVQASFHLINL